MIHEDSLTLEYLNAMNYGVVTILGSGKTFKSGTMYSLFEEVPSLKKRKKAFLNFAGLEYFPKDYGYYIDNVWDCEPDSILVIEDVNRLFPSRTSSKSEDLQRFIGVISHKDIVIFLTTQNTANVDMVFFRDQDNFTIHKYMNPTSIAYERPETASFCDMTNAMIYDTSYKLEVDWHYVSYVPMFYECLVLEDVPSYYGYEISHALRYYDPRVKEAVHG